MIWIVKKTALFTLLSMLSFGLFAQTDTLTAPSATTRGDMTARMASPRTAHGEVLRKKSIPQDLGGGTVNVYKLVVEDVFRKKKHSFTPEDFGAKNLQLARWVDSRYFMFIATDYVDIIGYYLYDTEQDTVYKCIYEVGEAIGYIALKQGEVFSPVIRDGEVSAYLTKP